MQLDTKRAAVAVADERLPVLAALLRAATLVRDEVAAYSAWEQALALTNGAAPPALLYMLEPGRSEVRLAAAHGEGSTAFPQRISIAQPDESTGSPFAAALESKRLVHAVVAEARDPTAAAGPVTSALVPVLSPAAQRPLGVLVLTPVAAPAGGSEDLEWFGELLAGLTGLLITRGRLAEVDAARHDAAHQKQRGSQPRPDATKLFLDGASISRRRLHAALARERRLHRQLEAAVRARDDFLSTLSHELRTPLQVIIGWAELLGTHELAPAIRRRGAQSIARNARQQAQLVSDLLDASRLAAGRMHLTREPFDFGAVVRRALDGVRAAADAKQIALTIDAPAFCELVSGDASRLQQAIWHLLANAVKFTPSGGKVRVSVSTADGRARLEIRDTGQGIAPELLRHVFDTFWQAEGTDIRRHGGLGLGLTVVRHIVEQHGGSVHAESLGERLGSTFVLELPLMKAERVTPAAEEELQPGLLGGVHVLVIEDERGSRVAATEALQRHGALVAAVETARDALFLLEQGEHFDVLVSDIVLPDDDGYHLLGQIRARTPLGTLIPALAMTRLASEQDRERARAAGFQAHVAKPVRGRELARTVASLSGRKTT